MKNPKLLILIGPPGSGKSTFAKYHIRTEQNWMRVCRDDFRLMHFSQSNLDDFQESMITKMVDASIEALLLQKTNVVVDATNLKKEYLDTFVSKFNHLADISFKVFDVAPSIVEERCTSRYKETGKYIPQKVMQRSQQAFKHLLANYDFSPRPKLNRATKELVISSTQDNTLPKALICDLDGTLALLNGRNPYDASTADKDGLNDAVANVLRLFKEKGYAILLVSGREDKYKAATLSFLEKHQISYDELLMRRSNDNRKDSIIKKEIFDTSIKEKYFIEFILDDRNQVVDMWRKELKLTCFQVNYGDF